MMDGLMDYRMADLKVEQMVKLQVDLMVYGKEMLLVALKEF